MRVLTMGEIGRVTGGGGSCSSDGGNNIGGIGDPDSIGGYLISVYEGLVAATSYVIERVADSL